MTMTILISDSVRLELRRTMLLRHFRHVRPLQRTPTRQRQAPPVPRVLLRHVLHRDFPLRVPLHPCRLCLRMPFWHMSSKTSLKRHRSMLQRLQTSPRNLQQLRQCKQPHQSRTQQQQRRLCRMVQQRTGMRTVMVLLEMRLWGCRLQLVRPCSENHSSSNNNNRPVCRTMFILPRRRAMLPALRMPQAVELHPKQHRRPTQQVQFHPAYTTCTAILLLLKCTTTSTRLLFI